MSDVAQMLAKKISARGPQPRSYVVLRVVISLAATLACLVVVVLWCRSYSWRDCLVVPISDTWFCSIESDRGKFEYESYGPDMGQTDFGVTALSHDDISAAWRRFTDAPQPGPGASWRWEKSDTGRFFIHVPHWFVAGLALVVIVAPWLSWRFSLRTLIISISVAAVTLGLLVWTNAPPRQPDSDRDATLSQLMKDVQQPRRNNSTDNATHKNDNSRSRPLDFKALASSLYNAIGQTGESVEVAGLCSITYQYNGPTTKVLDIVAPMISKSGFTMEPAAETEAATRAAEEAMGEGVLKLVDRKVFINPEGDRLSVTSMGIGKTGAKMLTITYMNASQLRRNIESSSNDEQ